MPFTLPRFREMARQALPSLFEGTIAPVGLFYLGYATLGLGFALALSLAWAYGSLVRRLVRREKVPGLVILSVVALTARTLLAVVTGSAFVYFLQPTLGTFLTGGIFGVSALAGQPLTERLAHDVVNLPAAVTGHPAVRELHLTLSVLWAAVFVVNGVVALWLLVSQSIGTFLVGKTVANGLLLAVGVVVSLGLFKRCVSRHAVSLEPA